MQAFTANAEFYGTTRVQEPVVSFNSSVICNFAKGIWASVDVTYYTGGSSTIDGAFRNDLQANWRTGATFSTPLSRHHGLRLGWSSGVYARTGNNFDQVVLTWQYRWGAGL